MVIIDPPVVGRNGSMKLNGYFTVTVSVHPGALPLLPGGHAFHVALLT
jgi:hypothetical protein